MVLYEKVTFSIDVFNPELESGSDAILKVDGISIKVEQSNFRCL